MSETEEQRGPEEIRADIDQTREELGDTAEALASKADVKSRAQERVDEVKSNVRDKRDEFLGKAKAATSGSSDGEGGGPTATASAGADQIKTKAQENPVPAGVAGGFVAGLLVGRILFGGRS